MCMHHIGIKDQKELFISLLTGFHYSAPAGLELMIQAGFGPTEVHPPLPPHVPTHQLRTYNLFPFKVHYEILSSQEICHEDNFF